MRETVVCVCARGSCRCVRATGAARVLFFHRFFFVFVHRSGAPPHSSPPPPVLYRRRRRRRRDPAVCINVPQSVTLVHTHTRAITHLVITYRTPPAATTTSNDDGDGDAAVCVCAAKNHRDLRQSHTRPPPTAARPSPAVRRAHPSIAVRYYNNIIKYIFVLYASYVRIIVYTSMVYYYNIFNIIICIWWYVHDVMLYVYTRSPVYR
ncbi:unnamed protein product [Aphis gossypii]|uniref:Uncharacterized protein n=1 Tax=Aphis gossypii TaxID=80765 RepID=A0A9P0NSG0_APHGO|nr:unnamed protein product [Aphis gossypii]